MATGNHYFLDAVAGAAVIALGALFTHAVPERLLTVPMGPERTVIHGVTRREAELARANVEQRGALRDWDPDEAATDKDRFCHARR
jgi:hypothetical protein